MVNGKDGMTYAGAGVDIDGKSKAIGALVSHLRYRRSHGPTMMDLPGQFTGLIGMGESVLTLCTDGVGTKLMVAKALGRWDTIGIDCVAMNVNDTICVGAEPIAFVDYLAVVEPDADLLGQIGVGLNKGCELADCDLIGGEVAVLPEIMRELDLSGSCLGLVRKDRLIDGSRTSKGDAVIGLPSSGLHSNGYTLARKVLEKAGIGLDDELPGLNGTVGQELLTPTEIYVRQVLKVLKDHEVHGMVDVTGGGLRNFLRTKRDLGVEVSDPMPVPPIFKALMEAGPVDDREAYQTFNMGLGFGIIVPDGEADGVVKACPGSRVIGAVTGDGRVTVPSLGIEYDRY